MRSKSSCSRPFRAHACPSIVGMCLVCMYRVGRVFEERIIRMNSHVTWELIFFVTIVELYKHEKQNSFVHYEHILLPILCKERECVHLRFLSVNYWMHFHFNLVSNSVKTVFLSVRWKCIYRQHLKSCK